MNSQIHDVTLKKNTLLNLEAVFVILYVQLFDALQDHDKISDVVSSADPRQ